MYRITRHPETNEVIGLQRLSDLAFIMIYDDNPAYQVYLAWLEAGNTPLLADSLPAEDK